MRYRERKRREGARRYQAAEAAARRRRRAAKKRAAAAPACGANEEPVAAPTSRARDRARHYRKRKRQEDPEMYRAVEAAARRRRWAARKQAAAAPACGVNEEPAVAAVPDVSSRAERYRRRELQKGLSRREVAVATARRPRRQRRAAQTPTDAISEGPAVSWVRACSMPRLSCTLLIFKALYRRTLMATLLWPGRYKNPPVCTRCSKTNSGWRSQWQTTTM
jgi:hypothetical protein